MAITGGCYGTGFAIAERFAKEGCNIFISGRDKVKADKAAETITERYNVFAKGYQTVSFSQDEVCSIFKDIEKSGFMVDGIVLNVAPMGMVRIFEI